jgi:hypothetical protein
VVGSFEHGGAPSDSGKGEEFLDQRNVYPRLENDPAPWRQ